MIWDVGLGAAANAMAAIHTYEEQAHKGPVRPMRLVSFENDLDSLKLARVNNAFFQYLRHAAPDGVLKEGRWESKVHAGLSWTLVAGDFLETMTQAPALPDLIFYDMFSSNSDDDHWTLGAFQRLFAVCGGQSAELFTYTCSTAIRAALLAAGFHVAKGRSTGLKKETTIALTPSAAGTDCRHDLLGCEWLEKWKRSGAKFPAGIAESEYPEFERTIQAHAQFRI